MTHLRSYKTNMRRKSNRGMKRKANIDKKIKEYVVLKADGDDNAAKAVFDEIVDFFSDGYNDDVAVADAEEAIESYRATLEVGDWNIPYDSDDTDYNCVCYDDYDYDCDYDEDDYYDDYGRFSHKHWVTLSNRSKNKRRVARRNMRRNVRHKANRGMKRKANIDEKIKDYVGLWYYGKYMEARAVFDEIVDFFSDGNNDETAVADAEEAIESYRDSHSMSEINISDYNNDYDDNDNYICYDEYDYDCDYDENDYYDDYGRSNYKTWVRRSNRSKNKRRVARRKARY